MSNAKTIFLAVLIPLLGSWLVVQGQFWLGATIANGLALIPFFLVGLYFASQLEISPNGLKITAMIIYLAVILIAIWFVALLTSCANGDCI